MKDYEALIAEQKEKIADAGERIGKANWDSARAHDEIGKLILERLKEERGIDFGSLVTCYNQVYEVTKFEVIGNDVRVFGRLKLPGDCYSPTVMLEQFDPATEDDLNRAKQMENGMCGCKEFHKACEQETDSSWDGACMVYDEGEWFTGKSLPAISFCPWCGKRIANPKTEEA